MIGQHIVYTFSPGTNLLSELAGYQVGQVTLGRVSAD
jgi:hypothetical protein